MHPIGRREGHEVSFLAYHQRWVPVAGRMRQSPSTGWQGELGSSIENPAGNGAGASLQKMRAPPGTEGSHCRYTKLLPVRSAECSFFPILIDVLHELLIN